MNQEVKVFVADVDDTLRGRKNRIPGPLTVSAFEEMHKRGIIVGIASGRPLWQGVKDHHKEWKLSFQFDFLIGMNGGEIWTKETQQKKVYNPLTCEELKEIVTAFRDIPNVNPFIYREGYELSRYIDDEMIESGMRHGCRVECVSDEAELYSEPTGKILYRMPTIKEAEKLEEYGKELFKDRIACFRTGRELVELQNPSIHKGFGITTYCNEHNISLDNVISFGDAENDIQMLECTGYSVALKNAMEPVKQIADDITDYEADEDGVGHYLWHHLLNR